MIWLSRHARNLLSTIKPVYISGTRGSGKTTILRSLATSEIARDIDLLRQFGSEKLSWYGQYLQFNSSLHEFTDRLSHQLADEMDDEEGILRVFSCYFELTLLLNVINDLLKLQENEFLHFKAKGERLACEELASILASVKWARGRQISDFQDAKRLIRDLQVEFLRSNSQMDIEGIRQLIDVLPQGATINYIRTFILPSLASTHFEPSKPLEFFLLLDDCESLSEEQQIALNTYIRRTEGVAKWVICYLSERYNSTQTFIRNTSLTGDDREILALDDISDDDFAGFAENVVNLRLRRHLDSLPGANKHREPAEFRFSRLFGSAESYNQLVYLALARSQRADLENFRRKVQETKAVLSAYIRPELHSRFSCGREQMPYIEHTVIEALDIKISAYREPDRQNSLAKTIDGKQAAAYIAVCAKLKIRPVYSGENFFKAIADRCIRDFLDAMAILYEVLEDVRGEEALMLAPSSRATNRFYSSRPLSSNLQDQVLKETSGQKLQGLYQLRASEPEVVRLVQALAALQQELEHDFETWESVKKPFRGRYILELAHSAAMRSDGYGVSDLRGIITRLEYDRYIKLASVEVTDNLTRLVFSLHRRLRPALNCGHVGPYDPPVVIPASLLLEPLNSDDSFEPGRWAQQLYDRHLRGPGSFSHLQNELPL